MKFYGKLPARPDPRAPSIHRLLQDVLLPRANLTSSWQNAVSGYGMLGNDQVGDCVVAMALHLLQTWSANVGLEIKPDTGSALATYSLFSGWNPVTGAGDTGLNIDDFLQKWVTVGIRPFTGSALVKLDSYAHIQVDDIRTIRECIYWFGGLAAGVVIPGDAEDEFDAKKPWADTSGAGQFGHGVPLVACDDDFLYCVTWGDGTRRVQPITYQWWQKYGDEVKAPVSLNWLKSDKSPSGLDLQQIESEAHALSAVLARAA